MYVHVDIGDKYSQLYYIQLCVLYSTQQQLNLSVCRWIHDNHWSEKIS